MNRQELIKAVAEKTDMTNKQSALAVDAVLSEITAALQSGDKVVLSGFGTFEVKERAARTGINPATKEKIEIPSSRLPVFKAGKQLKESVT